VELKHINHGYAVKNMSNDNENNDIEDVKVEEEALKETPLEAIKKQIMDKYGFTEEDHSDLIAKMAEEKMEDRKKLSSAIKQKIKLRDKIKASEPGKADEKIDKSKVDIDALIEQKVNEKLGNRELESANLSEDIKTQVKGYATLNKISISEAMKSDYIQYQITKAKEKEEVDDASISVKHDKVKTNKNFKDMNPSDFDVSTPEGRKEWEDYKKSLQA